MTDAGNGTSTNCSASCGARSGAPCGMVSSRMIVGTSITCSATRSSVTKNLTTSADWSTIYGTRTSTIGTGARDSMIGSTVCRRNRACGPAGSPRLGRPPPAGAPPRRAGRAPAGKEGASVPVARRACPRAPPPALVAVFSPRRAPYSACTLPLEWCNAAARAMRRVAR